jgi:hypothetical protein
VAVLGYAEHILVHMQGGGNNTLLVEWDCADVFLHAWLLGKTYPLPCSTALAKTSSNLS